MANILLPFVTTFDDKGVKKGQASLGALAKSSLAGALSVGVVVDQLGKAVRAAAEDQKAQEQLELAVRNNTTANTEQIAEMEKSIGRMEMQKAVADDELRPALGNLVRATGDVTKAQGLLNLALDISSATGRDLQSVTIALSRAQTGSMTALTRLGIPLNAAAVKSKDLEAIQADLAIRFAGASDAAANSADGGMKKLQIALDNAYEAVGYRLLPILNDYVTVLGDLSGRALDAEKNESKLGKAISKAFQQAVLKDFTLLNWAIGKYADNVKVATQVTDDFDRILRLQNMYMSKETVVLKDNEKAQRAAADAKKKARQAAKEYADTLRGQMQAAVETITDKVEKAQSEFDGFRNSMTSTFMGFASLSEAFQTNTNAITEEQEALKARSDAYTALGLAKQAGDIEDIAKATQDLAAAESAVNAATAKRSSTTTLGEFKKQIEAAKKFGNNLKIMIDNGLDQAGVAQFLNMGPVAGYEVSENLLATGQFASFKNSMAELSGIASSAGLASANAFFGGNLAAAQSAQGQVNTYQITVNAGLVSNPSQVGRDIIEAIKQAERVSGQVFVSV